MGNKLWNIIFYILIFALQLLISDFINLGPYVYICLLPIIITNFPRNIDVKVVMAGSFLIGLALDILTDEVLGLNAASAVLLAALYRNFYRMFINRDRQDTTSKPSPYTSGWNKYLKFMVFSIGTYLLTFILLETFSFRPVRFIVTKLALSLAISVITSVILSMSTIYKD